MASCRGFDLVRFRVIPSRAESLLSARSGAIEAFRRRRGLRVAYFVKLDGDEAVTELFKTGADLAEVAGYMDLMMEVLSEERGVLIDGEIREG